MQMPPQQQAPLVVGGAHPAWYEQMKSAEKARMEAHAAEEKRRQAAALQKQEEDKKQKEEEEKRQMFKGLSW